MRADLKELIDLDIQGCVWAYTPMGDSSNIVFHAISATNFLSREGDRRVSLLERRVLERLAQRETLPYQVHLALIIMLLTIKCFVRCRLKAVQTTCCRRSTARPISSIVALALQILN